MILKNDQIEDILKSPYNKNISHWQSQHQSYDLFVNGGDVTTKLERVKNFENASQKALRDKIARSTKDLMNYLLRPIDKVFSASGGNFDIDSSIESVKNKVSDIIQELPQGFSLREWMKVYWKDIFITDPNGIIYIETKDGDTYPTYKSISTVHDFRKKWNKFEYLVFIDSEVFINSDDDEKTLIFRVIDDEKDGLYYLKDDKLHVAIEEDKKDVIYHNLGYVPALNPSNLKDKKTGGSKSFIYPIDEILEEYLRDSSIHSIYKFLHGFPVKWQYMSKCTTCNGEGKVPNPRYKVGSTTETPKSKCPTCYGSGIKQTSDVSDGINLPLPKAGQEKIAPDLAGFIQPALETWDKQVEEMKEMKQDMHFSLWGTVVEDEKSNTATGRFIDAQPVNDTLESITDVAEYIETSIIDFIGKMTSSDNYKGCVNKWGRRYLIETPDTLWNKYLDAKEKEAPITSLDYHYTQYLMSEYHNDQVMMDRKMKEFNIEPFPHYSLDQLTDKLTNEQMQSKILFSEWNSTTNYDNPIPQLKKEFKEYVKQNIEENEIIKQVQN